ncbi:MAG: peptidoglycan DD-metalloendopeptidase family protein [Panacagrimonas sp.]
MIRKLVWLMLAVAVAVALAGCANLYTWSPPPKREAANQAVLPAPPPERPLGPSEYRVRPGDTMYSIAFRSSLDFRELAKWNGIGSDYLIRPGQVLRLAAPPPTQYRIGDTTTTAAPDLQVPTGVARPIPLPTQVPDVAVIPGDGAVRRYPPVTQPATPSAPAASLPTPPPVASLPSPPVPAAVPAAPPVSTQMPTQMPVPRPPAAVEHSGPYKWQWPTEGVVVRGYNPAAGSKGLDFTGQLGQTVVASAPGKVVYSGSALKGYGELIIIKHDDLRLSAYGYNRTRLVNEGQMVRGGQPIAELGLGPENKPVLHFEIRERGQPVNPVPYLPAKTAAR